MSEEITRLLKEYRAGEKKSEERLFSEVEAELKKIARGYMKKEDAHHTLQATALVHEAYIKLADHQELDWQNRAHFYALAATIMRRILIDYARAKKADKRGGEATHITLSGSPGVDNADVELIDLDLALKELHSLNERQAKVVELKFFGGMDVTEISEVLDTSAATIKRDWAFAKAWLYQRLSVNA